MRQTYHGPCNGLGVGDQEWLQIAGKRVSPGGFLGVEGDAVVTANHLLVM